MPIYRLNTAMNQLNTPITHPLAVGTKVTANRPSCPCKGAKIQSVTGVIQKIIHNQTGYWYYLGTGTTVKDLWVVQVN